MNTEPARSGRLPITRHLTLIYAFSGLIAVLLAASSVIGLLSRDVVYPTEELLRSFVANDVVNICIGLPILLASMWWTSRGRLIGLLLWPGALFFVIYNDLVYVLGMPLNVVHLLHVASLALSVYTIIALVASINGQAVRQRLSGSMPETVLGVITAGAGAIFLLQPLSLLISAVAGQTPIGDADLALHIVDFLIAPAWVIGGILLWRRQPLGYVTGLGLLFQISMLFVGLVILLLLRPLLTTAPFNQQEVLTVAALTVFSFAPFGFFVRGVLSRGRSSTD